MLVPSVRYVRSVLKIQIWGCNLYEADAVAARTPRRAGEWQSSVECARL